MIARVAALGRSFKGVTAYVMHDAPDPEREEERKPETAERVEWTETRNLATDRPEEAWRMMAATAKDAPGLKRLAGVANAGRKAAKPVYHYALSWKAGETPDRAEMTQAVDESLKKLGMADRQAVAHNDTPHRHVHVIVNRVDPETGRSANIGNDRLKLANWAERWERDRGRLQCPERAVNRKARRKRFVKDDSRSPGRYRREQMPLGRPPRAAAPPGVESGVWREAEEGAWDYAEHMREGSGIAAGARKEWREVLERQREQRREMTKLGRTRRGRWRLARMTGARPGEIAAAVRGRPEVLERWRKDLDEDQKDERVSLAKAHQESAGEQEQGIRDTYAHDAQRAAREIPHRRAWEAREQEAQRIMNRPRPQEPQRGSERGFER